MDDDDDDNDAAWLNNASIAWTAIGERMKSGPDSGCKRRHRRGHVYYGRMRRRGVGRRWWSRHPRARVRARTHTLVRSRTIAVPRRLSPPVKQRIHAHALSSWRRRRPATQRSSPLLLPPFVPPRNPCSTISAARRRPSTMYARSRSLPFAGFSVAFSRWPELWRRRRHHSLSHTHHRPARPTLGW